MNVQPFLEEMPAITHPIIKIPIKPTERIVDLFRWVWFYFGLRSEFLKTIGMFPEKLVNGEFVYNVAKAAVIDILVNRDVYGMLFEIIFDRSSKLNLDPLGQINLIINSLTNGKDPFSGFITFCAIYGDFILFLHYKGRFFNIDKSTLSKFWSENYVSNFEIPIRDRGGLKELSKAAHKQACIIPCNVLKQFVCKYCNPYISEGIPLLFEIEIRDKYKVEQNPSEYSKDSILYRQH